MRHEDPTQMDAEEAPDQRSQVDRPERQELLKRLREICEKHTGIQITMSYSTEDFIAITITHFLFLFLYIINF